MTGYEGVPGTPVIGLLGTTPMIFNANISGLFEDLSGLFRDRAAQ